MVVFVYHNLEDNIRDFFKKKSVTREQGDDFVGSHAGGVVVPVENQGAFSYTVTAGRDNAALFQFREQDSPIDIHTLALAKKIHPEFVVEAKYHGTVGDVNPIHVYEMDTLPGVGIPTDDISPRGNFIKDLAKSEWNRDFSHLTKN